jgi:hypothetical protein
MMDDVRNIAMNDLGDDAFRKFFCSSNIGTFTKPCARLDWILGLADEDPERSIAAQFSPILYCIEREKADSDTATAVAERPIPGKQFTRTCKLSRLNWLKIGEYYATSGALQHPVSAQLPVTRPCVQRLHVELLPQHSTFYVSGGRYDLPERLRRAVELHSAVPSGIGFFAFTDPSQSTTVVIPCSEVLRSCYGEFGDFLNGLNGRKTHNSTHAPAETPGEFGYSGNTLRRNVARAEYMRRLRRDEPNQLLARALVHGKRGAPRPILVRPPLAGAVVLSGNGYRLSDEQGDVVFICHDLDAETQFYREFYRRKQERWLQANGELATFAPAFYENHVALLELNAKAPHGKDERIRNYDIHGFTLQVLYIEEMFRGPQGVHDLSILRDPDKWRFTYWRDNVTKHHSITVSARFLRVRKPRSNTRDS